MTGAGSTLDMISSCLVMEFNEETIRSAWSDASAASLAAAALALAAGAAPTLLGVSPARNVVRTCWQESRYQSAAPSQPDQPTLGLATCLAGDALLLVFQRGGEAGAAAGAAAAAAAGAAGSAAGSAAAVAGRRASRFSLPCLRPDRRGVALLARFDSASGRHTQSQYGVSTQGACRTRRTDLAAWPAWSWSWPRDPHAASLPHLTSTQRQHLVILRSRMLPAPADDASAVVPAALAAGRDRAEFASNTGSGTR